MHRTQWSVVGSDFIHPVYQLSKASRGAEVCGQLQAGEKKEIKREQIVKFLRKGNHLQIGEVIV